MKERFDELVEHLLSGNIEMQEAVGILERKMIQRALERNTGNQSAASKQLGIHRNTLLRKMHEYEIGNGRPRRKPVVRAVKTKKRKNPAA